MKKVVETVTCDICGELAKTRINVPVKWLTEQTEGHMVKPYYAEQTLDLCDSCLEKVVVINATGCMGNNEYKFR